MTATTDNPKNGKHNVARALRFRTKPIGFLRDVAASGSLASAAAEFEILRRG
jgi:hypothetical protein